jgi:hypothetical protein
LRQFATVSWSIEANRPEIDISGFRKEESRKNLLEYFNIFGPAAGPNIFRSIEQLHFAALRKFIPYLHERDMGYINKVREIITRSPTQNLSCFLRTTLAERKAKNAPTTKRRGGKNIEAKETYTKVIFPAIHINRENSSVIKENEKITIKRIGEFFPFMTKDRKVLDFIRSSIIPWEMEARAKAVMQAVYGTFDGVQGLLKDRVRQIKNRCVAIAKQQCLDNKEDPKRDLSKHFNSELWNREASKFLNEVTVDGVDEYFRTILQGEWSFSSLVDYLVYVAAKSS